MAVQPPAKRKGQADRLQANPPALPSNGFDWSSNSDVFSRCFLPFIWKSKRGMPQNTSLSDSLVFEANLRETENGKEPALLVNERNETVTHNTAVLIPVFPILEATAVLIAKVSMD